MYFIFDYLIVILPRQLLSTATTRYSTDPLDVDFSTEPLMTTFVYISIPKELDWIRLAFTRWRYH